MINSTSSNEAHYHSDEDPRTYNRGSNPIDGIFMTQDLFTVQGVYMPLVLILVATTDASGLTSEKEF
jgi:hypothetical protein